MLPVADAKPGLLSLLVAEWEAKGWTVKDLERFAMVNFFRRGTTKLWFVPTIAAIAAPTAAEVNAGTDMTTATADVAGFSFQNQPIPTPNFATTFDATIPGNDQVQQSSITFYEDKTSNPIRTALVKGTAGYVVIFYAGIAGSVPAASDKAEVWPVISAGPVRLYTMGNEAAKWRADFNPSAVPSTAAVLA